MKHQAPDTVCPNPKCGKVFEEPLLLRDLSKNPTERYYVCPHCIIKLDNFQVQDEEKPPPVPPVPVEPPRRLGETDSPKCTHHVGYLKTLPKSAQIPDDCLTCPKLLRCMSKE
ncbi:hypothetical protein GWO13_05960 [Candidatus Bathyarchaeota archaeon]|nr:hypothetical protein [Candidatus Bathyarchaeota archaeon]